MKNPITIFFHLIWKTKGCFCVDLLMEIYISNRIPNRRALRQGSLSGFPWSLVQGHSPSSGNGSWLQSNGHDLSSHLRSLRRKNTSPPFQHIATGATQLRIFPRSPLKGETPFFPSLSIIWTKKGTNGPPKCSWPQCCFYTGTQSVVPNFMEELEQFPVALSLT